MSERTIPLTHRERVKLDLAELADVVMQLGRGVDRVLYFVSEKAYMIVTPADIPAVEAFISDESDTLALPGGMLDVLEGWAE